MFSPKLRGILQRTTLPLLSLHPSGYGWLRANESTP